MALTSPSSTDIYVLLDESGSMAEYTALTRQCVTTMMDGNIDPKIKYTVIAFSEQTEHGTNLSKFRAPQHKGTEITPAFRLLHNLVQKKTLPERIIVVFVSDGMDTATKNHTLADNLNKLGKLPVHSLLFTVGVGSDFPTGLVIDVLRPLYHMGHASVQSVLPVTSPDEIHWAFGQLEALMLEELNCLNSAPDSIDASTSTKALVLYTQARYNECVITCTATGQTARQNYERLFNTKTAISEVARLAKERLNSERAGSSGEQKPVKPLVSNLLKETVYSPKACLTSALSAISRLNNMINEASKGRIMSELSDEAKKELLGGQYVEGKLIAVANKYRAANFGTTKNSLLRLLRTYTPSEQDRQLEDQINLTRQDEYFEDARQNLQDLIPLTHTLPGILKMLSFVCRTITFKEPLPLDALQMNEWLAEVEALPQVIQRMTTFDFLERHSGCFASRGEKINGLMVLGGDRTSPGIFHHVQSLLLLKHPGLFILTARLAVAGSVLFFLLGSHDTLRPWMLHELKLVDGICNTYTRQGLESWHIYVETVTNPDFRMCLVTESPKLPAQCKCPGLTKFILALYVAATGGLGAPPRLFSIEELKDRHHATVVEFLARTRIAVPYCLQFDAKGKAEELLQQALAAPATEEGECRVTIGESILAASLTLSEAKLRFGTMIGMALNVDTFVARVIESAKLTAKQIKAARHYQFSIARINSTFKNLASICGYGDDVSFNMSKAELLGALQTANRLTTGYERFSAYSPPKTPTKEEITALVSRLATEQLRKIATATADAVIEKLYMDRHRERHSQLARIIPTQHMERFKQEFGLDISKDWGVNASGLSNHACCSPECSYYLELLNQNPAVRCVEICPMLRQHLMMGTNAQPLPGFHKTVSRHRDATPRSVAAKVEAGECLTDPIPTGMGSKCLESLSGLQNPTAMAYMQRRLAASVEEKRTKLMKSVTERCRQIRFECEDALEEEVVDLQLEYSAPTWPYDDFKEVFLAKYKKYPRLHGDNPLFAQP